MGSNEAEKQQDRMSISCGMSTKTATAAEQQRKHDLDRQGLHTTTFSDDPS